MADHAMTRYEHVATPEPEATDRPRTGPVDWAVQGFALAPWWLMGLGGLAILLIIVPRFGEIFKDFGVQLSPLTRGYLSLSDTVTGSPLAILVSLAVVVLVGLLLVPLTSRRSPLRFPLLVIGWVLALLAVPVTIAAMYGPLVAMIESLQGGGL